VARILPVSRNLSRFQFHPEPFCRCQIGLAGLSCPTPLITARRVSCQPSVASGRISRGSSCVQTQSEWQLTQRGRSHRTGTTVLRRGRKILISARANRLRHRQRGRGSGTSHFQSTIVSRRWFGPICTWRSMDLALTARERLVYSSAGCFKSPGGLLETELIETNSRGLIMSRVATNERREHFIKAASRVLREHGVARATTRRIAKEAGAPLAANSH
jgi:hypothetical protein